MTAGASRKRKTRMQGTSGRLLRAEAVPCTSPWFIVRLSPARQARPRNRRPQTKKGEGHGPSPGKPPTQSMGGRSYHERPLLRRTQHLAEGQGVEVAEHRRARRQQRRRQELRVEGVATIGRPIDDVAALVGADGLAAREEAEDRAAVVEVRAAPVARCSAGSCGRRRRCRSRCGRCRCCRGAGSSGPCRR